MFHPASYTMVEPQMQNGMQVYSFFPQRVQVFKSGLTIPKTFCIVYAIVDSLQIFLILDAPRGHRHLGEETVLP